MNRRNALKKMGFAAGFMVATPTIIGLLQGCTSTVETWVPQFLKPEQGVALTKLTEIILPQTETLPSGKMLNVPQFIDRYFHEVLDDEDQAFTKMAFERMMTDLQPNKEIKVEDIPDQDYMALLDKFMLLKAEIDPEREADLEALAPTKSEFLNNLKYLMASAYTHSEEIGENVLVYDPVPTQNYCGDLEELTGGKSYSANNGLF